MILRTLKRGSRRWSRRKHWTFDASRTSEYGDGNIVFRDDEGHLMTIQLTTQEEIRQMMSAIHRIDKAFEDEGSRCST